jgi:hypothetical protein
MSECNIVVSTKQAHLMIFFKKRKKEKMSGNRKQFFLRFASLCLLITLFGCASPAYRTHSEFRARVKNIGIPVLVLSDVRIYEISPGGTVELRDDWCAMGKYNLLSALLANLKDKHYNVKPLIPDKGVEKEMKEVQALYRAVNRSIKLHTYGPQIFPEKLRNFTYSLGSIERILRKCEADSLILVDALGHISTNKPRASVSLCVSDSSGTIIWYCVKGSLGEYDLRDPESATELVKDICSCFPEVSG